MSPISNFRTLLSLFILRETSWSIFFFSVSNFWLISFLKLILPPFVAVAVFFVVVGADVFGFGAALAVLFGAFAGVAAVLLTCFFSFTGFAAVVFLGAVFLVAAFTGAAFLGAAFLGAAFVTFFGAGGASFFLVVAVVFVFGFVFGIGRKYTGF